jgi:prepilin-type processing-associated H-X9-DG protein
LVPAVQKVRDAAARTQCLNNLKQLGLACHGYHDTNKKMPPGASGPAPSVQWPQFAGNLSYAVYILPFIEQANLYSAIKFTEDYSGPTNSAVLNVPVPVYQCPASSATESVGGPLPGKAIHYYGVLGPKGGLWPKTGQPYPFTPTAQGGWSMAYGVLGINSKTKIADIIDGTSNTLLLGEISYKDANSFRPWSAGWDGTSCYSAKNVVAQVNQTGAGYNGTNNFNDVGFGSNHSGGATFTFADGSARFVTDAVALNVLQALATYEGREVVSVPE